jgi:hypothetical protein
MADQKVDPQTRAAEIVADAERRGNPCPPAESKAWRVAQWVSIIFAVGVAVVGFVFGAGSFTAKASAAQTHIEQHEKRDDDQDKRLEAKADKDYLQPLRDDIKENRGDVKTLLLRVPAK